MLAKLQKIWRWKLGARQNQKLKVGKLRVAKTKGGKTKGLAQKKPLNPLVFHTLSFTQHGMQMAKTGKNQARA